jgi:hypothetical protein
MHEYDKDEDQDYDADADLYDEAVAELGRALGVSSERAGRVADAVCDLLAAKSEMSEEGGMEKRKSRMSKKGKKPGLAIVLEG